jgi:hypothetical protein
MVSLLRTFLATLLTVNPPQDFVTWATDPARSADELFAVEILIEGMRHFQNWPFRDRREPFDREMQTMKARKFNPAYRPALPLAEIELLQKRAASVFYFGGPSGVSDRPLRDLQALRFFPQLEEIQLDSSDIFDLSPLASLKKVQNFSIGEYGDVGGCHPLVFAQCGEMPEVEHLRLSLRHAWPDLRAIANWPALREFYFNGNLLTLADVRELPAAEFVQAHKWVGHATSLRDLNVFPAMPKVKQLGLQDTSSLTGIERYPSVVNLEIGGEFRDLTPLLALTNVTCLKLTGEYFTDLAPLTRMPSLREIIFVRERPLDLAVLTDAPQLRRVEFERCAIIRTELAALNAGLLPEENDFLAEKPRKLAPFKFYSVSKGNRAGRWFFNRRVEALMDARDDFYAGDAAFADAETRSATSALQAGLDRLLGRGWGLLPDSARGSSGEVVLGFKRYQDTTRIREIIQLLREHSARSRFPWNFSLMVEPHGDMSYELEQLKELEEKAREPEGHWLKDVHDPDEVLRENQESLQRYEEKYELLEREHLYQLQEDPENFVDPTLLQPPPSAELATDEPEDEQPLTESSDADDDDENIGGVAIAMAPPPPALPDTPDLSDQLSYAIEVFEDCVVVHEGWHDRARYGLGESPMEWTE